jgi:hypothetical protein
MTQGRTAGTFDEPVMADADHDPLPPEAAAANGRPAPSVARDFARLRNRLLALLDGRAQQDRAETDALRAQLGLSDRSFGELWAACSCNGDLKRWLGRRRW